MAHKDTTAPAPTTAQAAPPAASTSEPKAKRKTSRGLKRIQKLERGVAKSSRRVSEAVAKGLRTYMEQRDRSAEKRRDGALRDAAENVARGVGKTMKVASRAPLDLAKPLGSKSMTKGVRRALRRFMRPFGG